MEKMLAIILLLGCSVSGFAIDLNGDFEQCATVPGGGLWPKGWHINKNVTQNAIVELCEDTAAVHSGKYAVFLECEKGGRAYIFHHPLVAAQKTETLKLSVFLRGYGEFTAGFVIFGYVDNPKKLVCLTSISSQQFSAEKKKWSEHKWTVRLGEMKKDGVIYSNFMLMPFLNMNGEGSILTDSYQLEQWKEPDVK